MTANADAAAETDRDTERDDGERHDTSWSAKLEAPRHADDEALVCAAAVDAVERTADGVHVNLVTHGDLGHPETYLYPALADRFGDDVTWRFVDRCGCGGYVTRVTK
ncbi:CGCGG family putative rSAM-modified RiPP protein [Halobaculum lipolyticum]|uniref:CGCGG family rSAM-modified RiPP protein n=1 Tax=Halobaculum lipolyticum TaxID=3032001 RepID=A0ABD5WC42_9EURY|nr:CGCGG family rSAM-modified RiPP protein [Halobaculum sp. DT31]